MSGAWASMTQSENRHRPASKAYCTSCRRHRCDFRSSMAWRGLKEVLSEETCSSFRSYGLDLELLRRRRSLSEDLRPPSFVRSSLFGHWRWSEGRAWKRPLMFRILKSGDYKRPWVRLFLLPFLLADGLDRTRQREHGDGCPLVDRYKSYPGGYAGGRGRPRSLTQR